MDKILIKSDFMKGIISKLIQRSIKKHLDINADARLDYLNVDTMGDFVTIHVDGKVKIRKDDFLKLVMKEL